MDECCICLEEYKRGTKKVLKCGHELCIFCLNYVSSCPLCRGTINICEVSVFEIGIKTHGIKVKRIIRRKITEKRVCFFQSIIDILKSYCYFIW